MGGSIYLLITDIKKASSSLALYILSGLVNVWRLYEGSIPSIHIGADACVLVM